jgi:hypothetical protein
MSVLQWVGRGAVAASTATLVIVVATLMRQDRLKPGEVRQVVSGAPSYAPRENVYTPPPSKPVAADTSEEQTFEAMRTTGLSHWDEDKFAGRGVQVFIGSHSAEDAEAIFAVSIPVVLNFKRVPDGDLTVVISARYVSRAGNPDECGPPIFLFDRRPVVPKKRIPPQLVTGNVVLSEAVLSKADVLRLKAAESIDWKICGVGHSLSKRQIQTMRGSIASGEMRFIPAEAKVAHD